MDLSSTTDLSAMALVFPMPDDLFRTLVFFWVPQENIADRARRDRVPYDLWSRAGLIEATPGNVIDYQAILRRFDQLAKDFDVQELGYDPWGATKLVQDIVNAGFPAEKLVEIRQGNKTLSPPTKELHKLVRSGKFEHDGNPVLRWNVSNTMLEISEPELWKPSKKKSTERIDGCVALICALSRAMVHTEAGESVYESRGFQVV